MGLWRAFLRGRQRRTTVRAQNKQKNSEKFYVIWGGIITGHFCARIHLVKRRVGDEMTEGHQVFATPPCPKQRRLAIVITVAFTKMYCDQLFLCWEEKLFS